MFCGKRQLDWETRSGTPASGSALSMARRLWLPFNDTGHLDIRTPGFALIKTSCASGDQEPDNLDCKDATPPFRFCHASRRRCW